MHADVLVSVTSVMDRTLKRDNGVSRRLIRMGEGDLATFRNIKGNEPDRTPGFNKRSIIL